MGFSPLVVLYALGNRFIMFLLWMVISMSSATSLSRLKFGSLILYGELFFGFDLFYFKCSTTGHTDKVTIFELRQDKEVIKFSLAISLV